MTQARTSEPSMVPLHLSGNTTDFQRGSLQKILQEAAQNAYQAAVDALDQQNAQATLDNHRDLARELTELIVETIQRHSYNKAFLEEDVGSERTYPETYRIKPVEAQVTELRKLFPELASCEEKLGHRHEPGHAEGWFAIPRWQLLAPTYNEAVERVIQTLESKRRFSNRLLYKLGPEYLRQNERTKLALKLLGEQQPGKDILVLGAQFGLLHRGSSARRTRSALESNEFCLGAFEVGCMLLTHPLRLSNSETLMIDCAGDEYSVRGDKSFDRVPLFDFDLSGIEFSIFYQDRARSLWGSPTGFLFTTL